MSSISEILISEEPNQVLQRFWDQSPCEIIPALILLYIKPKGQTPEAQEETKAAASSLLIRVISQSNFSATATIIDPNKCSSTTPPAQEDDSISTRQICRTPHGTTVTTRTITFAIHIFVALADGYEIQILKDALDAFVELSSVETFHFNTRMMLDIVNFLLLFHDKESPFKQKAKSLFDIIHHTAELDTDAEVLAVTNSVLALFPFSEE